ncbi:MAG TPA: hypothetical protein VLA28_02450 [Afifellaceae bacterium]|nr:hypothetical protein [Afifellaceae bacterium]
MARVLVAIAVISAVMVSTVGASAARLPRGMKWVTPGVVRLVGYDSGGFLARYLIDLEILKSLRVRQLQLDETCASACTVFLRLGKRVCVTDRARIGFHRIIMRNRPGTTLSRKRAAEYAYNDRYLRRLPAKIRNWHGIRDGLPLRTAWLRGEEAARLIGRCA